ncbi:hypothetical protein [Polynucleobacter sp. KF022]|nr:hypothetical protein [Polynucleobacter sp. KF022]BDT75332.1 hypothetical protein PKF022_09970 [Polynucleobacter sp. KF022]
MQSVADGASLDAVAGALESTGNGGLLDELFTAVDGAAGTIPAAL